MRMGLNCVFYVSYSDKPNNLLVHVSTHTLLLLLLYYFVLHTTTTTNTKHHINIAIKPCVDT